jgi:hypothetical protein
MEMVKINYKKVLTGSVLSLGLLIPVSPTFAATIDHNSTLNVRADAPHVESKAQKILVRKTVSQVSMDIARWKVEIGDTIKYDENGYYGTLTANRAYSSTDKYGTKYYVEYVGYAYSDIGT